MVPGAVSSQYRFWYQSTENPPIKHTPLHLPPQPPVPKCSKPSSKLSVPHTELAMHSKACASLVQVTTTYTGPPPTPHEIAQTHNAKCSKKRQSTPPNPILKQDTIKSKTILVKALDDIPSPSQPFLSVSSNMDTSDSLVLPGSPLNLPTLDSDVADAYFPPLEDFTSSSQLVLCIAKAMDLDVQQFFPS